MQKAQRLSAPLAIAIILTVFDRRLDAEELKAIEVPGDRAFTESVTAGPDGTLYLSSLALGGIARVKPGASKAEAWIAPGAFESRSTFGVFADATSNTLWVCSNDVSSIRSGWTRGKPRQDRAWRQPRHAEGEDTRLRQ